MNYFLIFWLAFSTKLMSKKPKIPLYAFYTPSHQILKDNWFLPSLKDDFKVHMSFVRQKGNGEFGEKDYSDAIEKKVGLIIKAIKKNKNKIFVYSDVDIQFFRPIEDFIVKELEDLDIIVQKDTPDNTICAGFFAAKANKKILQLWKRIKEGMKKQEICDDQIILNEMLLLNNDLNIQWHFLPSSFLGGGTLTGKVWEPGNELPLPEELPYLHHANWTIGVENKIEQLKYIKNKVYEIQSAKQSDESKQSPSAVSFVISGGRLGDSLIGYARGLFFAKKHTLPFFRRQFKYDTHLTLSCIDEKMSEKEVKKYEIVENTTKYTDKGNNGLYIFGTFPEGQWRAFDHFFLDIRADKTFLEELRKRFTPLKKIKKAFPFHTNYLSVAVHMRKGGGYDSPLYSETQIMENNDDEIECADKIWPLKFPPETFYIDQIQFLTHLFPKKPLYVYIFTDDPHPEMIAQKLKKHINYKKIIFDYRKKDNGYDKNVLEDLTRMCHFDVLIRPNSSYSMCAQLIGYHKMVIYPQEAHWQGNELIIDQVGIVEEKNNNSIVTSKKCTKK